MRNLSKHNQGSIQEYCMTIWQKTYLLWLPLIAAFIFVAISLAYDIYSEKSEFFSRSGAVMAMSGVWVGYIEAKWSFVSDTDKSGKQLLFLDPDESLKKYAIISFIYGLVGTAIWGYGDLFICIISDLI